MYLPVGSEVAIPNPNSAITNFVPDVTGEYIVSLIVNDGTLESEPDIVTITTITPEEAALEVLIDAISTIDGISPENLHNENADEPLRNKMNAALTMINEGDYEQAFEKLQNDILKKTDGCAGNSQPDATDWILNCEDQAELYPLVIRAIKLLEQLLY